MEERVKLQEQSSQRKQALEPIVAVCVWGDDDTAMGNRTQGGVNPTLGAPKAGSQA